MRDNQGDENKFSAKISDLRMKVLKLDGMKTVDGISEGVKDKRSTSSFIDRKIAEEFFLAKEQD